MHTGDEVTVWPGNQHIQVRGIYVGSRQVSYAVHGMSVALQFSHSGHISRGSYLFDPSQGLLKSRQPKLTVCWLSEKKCDFEASYLLKNGHNLYNVRMKRDQSWDSDWGKENDIFNVTVNLACEMAFDPYKMNRKTGSVVFIDPITFETCAAGFLCPL